MTFSQTTRGLFNMTQMTRVTLHLHDFCHTSRVAITGPLSLWLYCFRFTVFSSVICTKHLSINIVWEYYLGFIDTYLSFKTVCTMFKQLYENNIYVVLIHESNSLIMFHCLLFGKFASFLYLGNIRLSCYVKLSSFFDQTSMQVSNFRVYVSIALNAS